MTFVQTVILFYLLSYVNNKMIQMKSGEWYST